MGKTALVTGVTGQDGSYMAELLLSKGYEVHGMVRRNASPNLWRLESIKDKIKLIPGDLTDQSSIDRILKETKYDEVYNFAAQSYVSYSFVSPLSTADITGVGVLRLLESVRQHSPSSRVFQASTSEMYGKVQETPQRETTRFYPRSPYGAAKAFAHHTAVNYRESYSLYIACGIMFNHESPRRGEEFVTRKITKGIAQFKKTGQKISLGNLNASRDWGAADEFVEGAWRMLQQPTPDDYILASGETHTVKEWLEEACRVGGVDFWDVYTQNPTFNRQAEVDFLKGDYSKARTVLGWEPKKKFSDIVKWMVEEDEALLNNTR